MNALILSGGGARASYQVGVLLAVSDILPHLRHPFKIISGTSAGAINAAALAAHPGSFRFATHDLANTWHNIAFEHVIKTGWSDLVLGALRVATSLLSQGYHQNIPLALLDNRPLRELLTRVIPFYNIQQRINQGKLHALCITALGYNSGESVSFFQGVPSQRGWRRYRRVGAPATISVEHLMASSAIPIIFPTVKLSKEYFGDGAMRQMAPISSALHLGASRLFIIGVSGNRVAGPWGHAGKFAPPRHAPSLAQIIGQVFNSVFIDTLEGDIEHMERINSLIEHLREGHEQVTGPLRKVEALIISPSKRLDIIARRRIRSLPPSLRFFMGATGASAKGGGASAASYLLFTHAYCDELIDLGYQDAMQERDNIERFFAH